MRHYHPAAWWGIQPYQKLNRGKLVSSLCHNVTLWMTALQAAIILLTMVRRQQFWHLFCDHSFQFGKLGLTVINNVLSQFNFLS